MNTLQLSPGIPDPRTPGPATDRRFQSRKDLGYALVANGRIRLRGELRWRFEASPDDVHALVGALPAGMVERLTETVALLDFGNAVGFFDVPGVGRLEVSSGKWGEDEFELMLGQLTEIATGLPFTSGSAAALPYDRSVAAHEDVLYHAFVYLRHVLLGPVGKEPRLTPALEMVLREPHRRFDRTVRVVPTERACRVEPRGLARLATARDGVYPAPAALRHLPLARRMRTHLPERVEESAVVASYDTPENRFVKAFLGVAMGVIIGMRLSVGEGSRAFSVRVRQDCDRMDRLLRPAAQNTFWRDIGPMVHLPAGSTVLQRRRGYKHVFEHWSRLRLATRLPLSRERVRDLLEVKDIAELYELWCFFVLVLELEGILGPPLTARRYEVTPTQLSVPWDLEVRWRNGTTLHYNPRFGRSRSQNRRSYSLPLRPDVALEVATGPNQGLHLFDAKFRVDALAPLLVDEDESLEDAVAERRGQFKRGDLYKMHTYRDAIPRARSVWIVYPGTETHFYAASVQEWHSTGPLPILIDGVGAIACAPGMPDRATLRAVLFALIASSDESLL